GCPRCGAETETLLHALKDCPTSRAVLSIGGWSRNFISKNYDRCIDWLEELMRVFDKRAMADLMTILWNCWNNRNNYIFRGKEEEAKQIWERAMEKKWKKPPKNSIKVNFDATVGENRCGYGTVIKDEEGFVLGGGGGYKEGRLSVEEAECMAFEESIKVACSLNIKDHVLFEIDHVGLVNKFNNLAHDVTTIGARIKKSWLGAGLLMKFMCWNYRGLGNPAKLRELKQLLVANNPDLIFPSETKMSANEFQSVQNKCKWQNGLTVNSEGRSGGLAMMWRDGMNVSIQKYFKYHIDSMVKLENNKTIRVTGFYGHTNPNHRSSSWDILRRVGELVREEWVVGGDFNAILNDAEKEGGRRGVRAQMNEFKD
ncbi:hypothetical protein Gohar_025736, partial [Gossypium harknessii]|nr:hypothetical protein [Gossypium harknessii]